MTRLLLIFLIGLFTFVNAVDYSWVPQNKCFLCYQGEEEAIRSLAKIDFVNPCRQHAVVKKGTCSGFGWKKEIGPDPVLKHITLYTNKEKIDLSFE